jgi:RNA polymerase-binding protein DksA
MAIAIAGDRPYRCCRKIAQASSEIFDRRINREIISRALNRRVDRNRQLNYTNNVRRISVEQNFVETMRKILMEDKEEIISNLAASSESFREITEGGDPKDLADIASDDIDRKMIEAIGSEELKRLKLINSALTRIQQGKYGLCMKCNKRIPQDRLEALPHALMCIQCKTAEERRNR